MGRAANDEGGARIEAGGFSSISLRKHFRLLPTQWSLSCSPGYSSFVADHVVLHSSDPSPGCSFERHRGKVLPSQIQLGESPCCTKAPGGEP